jgi:hypothetical protein
VITDVTSVLGYHLNLPRNRHKALAVGRFTGAARQPATKGLFIPQCCDTFKVSGRRKQHFIMNVTIDFVSSVDHVLW